MWLQEHWSGVSHYIRERVPIPRVQVMPPSTSHASPSSRSSAKRKLQEDSIVRDVKLAARAGIPLQETLDHGEVEFIGRSTFIAGSYADAPKPSAIIWDFVVQNCPGQCVSLSACECQPSSVRAQLQRLQKFGLPRPSCPRGADLLLWLFSIGLALLPSLSCPLLPESLDPEGYFPRALD